MDFVKDKVNQVSETVQGKGSEAAAKSDKEVVKGNTGADAGTRVGAAKDYLVDTKDQKSHEGKANLHDAKSEAR